MLTSSSLSKTSVLRLSTYIHRQLNRPYFASTQTVLGIETSCDDTGCAIVDSNAKVLSETLFSQNIVHLRYGGVNPTVARDLHRDNIELAVSTAIQNSKIEVQNVNAVAVTVKPGLLASLQIGVKYEFNHGILGDEIIPEVNELCASFQMAIVQHIIQRTERAIKFCELNNFITSDNKTIVVSGGVACNNFIFKHLQLLGNDFGFNVVRPPPKVCTDNGVMIAWNGIEKMKKKLSFKKVTLNDVDPAAALGVNISKRVAAAGIQVKLRKIKHL
ncbi:unnamed protein product, partial [Leptidea sinapis]